MKAIAGAIENRKLIFFLLAMAAFCFLMAYQNRAEAFSSVESSPGVVQLRSNGDRGLVVTRVSERKLNKHRGRWIYFCVADVHRPHRIAASSGEKCFYGRYKEYRKTKVGQLYSSIEFGLRNRLHNDKGYIAIGAERYFYPAFVAYELK